MRRREFLTGASGALAGTTALAFEAQAATPRSDTDSIQDSDAGAAASKVAPCAPTRRFNGIYEGEHLNQVAFPLGGIGAGMFCLEGAGALTKFSFHHHPNLDACPLVFAALSIQSPQPLARILEGPVPAWKLRPRFSGISMIPPIAAYLWGLPRFCEAVFDAQFPFANIRLTDDGVPLQVGITGWSPFAPGDVDNASLPVAGLEYEFINRGAAPIEAQFSFNSQNIMADAPPSHGLDPESPTRVLPTERGFILHGPGAKDHPRNTGFLAVWVGDAGAQVQVNHAWFMNGWLLDSLRMTWNDIASCRPTVRAPLTNAPGVGASLFVPFKLSPGERKTIRLCFAWYVPASELSIDEDSNMAGVSSRSEPSSYRPWYADRFKDIEDVKHYWQDNYAMLRQAAQRFSRALYDSTLPAEVMEAVTANLTILKSPTVLRQTDGRLWAWEGSGDDNGAGPGSCTHVWNYAQALPHLFPGLERVLRETEFGPDQGSDGYQASRSFLPIRAIGDEGTQDSLYGDAADGQTGGIIKVYREWRISGDTQWLRTLWPRIRASLDYCIRTWDPKHKGWLEESHGNTYDCSFWGPDSMCTSLYLGALKAAMAMGKACGARVGEYEELLQRGLKRLEAELFNGEYFFQKIEWQALEHPHPRDVDLKGESPDSLELARREGPSYQYGTGCFADGVLGAWLCRVCGIDELLDPRKVESHLAAVHRHNFKAHLTDYPQLGRSMLGTGEEGGLLLCTWPRGGRLPLPVMYSDEVWTGVEYQVASHLISIGRIEQGLEIVRVCRQRYDGRVRNPFSEVEAVHWYGRALSSYALLQAFSGARYDAVDKVLHLKPSIKGDFRSFLSTATGYGTVGVRDGRPFVEVVSGTIPYKKIEYKAA